MMLKYGVKLDLNCMEELYLAELDVKLSLAELEDDTDVMDILDQ